ncbi:hypothetical protein PF005_g24235 [Phytophthora fragariae]|uniref:RxLR effector protein n=2 Tax=Phytophthora TaxID=4783 RepID=A0A6A3FFQ6_9STRA|nr:hypothetical protein PF003_g19715 [Phytophthora fragariae]KAE8984011.1 hypothetical protein PR001_g23291 [Phytophthora rubi]KAE8943446.1 hypothetical protein PF009_g6830 [Phytophthora fragariae]KAE8975810.1 hypothetical protein PF011_g24318 [Phytophthora fragariae]KAE9015936.1 hypothetical protein PR002_g13795 [Phytophthora rubi]
MRLRRIRSTLGAVGLALPSELLVASTGVYCLNKPLQTVLSVCPPHCENLPSFCGAKRPTTTGPTKT